MTTHQRFSVVLFLIAVLIMGAAVVSAQDEGGVTADEVNAIASKLYCPVCENIPLDTCGTAACADWRNEIRIALESGASEQEIVTDFIRRFGDRVVGVPQDPALNTLSLWPPIIGIVLVVIGGLALIINLRRPSAAHEVEESPRTHKTSTQELPAHPHDKSKYFDVLEQDLKG